MTLWGNVFGFGESSESTLSQEHAIPAGRESTSILDAVENGDLEKVKMLLENNPRSVLCRDNIGLSALHAAALKGDTGLVKLLLDSRADVNAAYIDGSTPLHFAAYGHKDIVELLLANRADVNSKDNIGYTPLHLAARRGYQDIVELLLANKADVNAKDNRGQTPLHQASENGYSKVVELLLAYKADANAKDLKYYAPLHKAVEQGYKDVAKLLLDSRADVNAECLDGTTPLHLAMENGHRALAELLLANKAAVNAKSYDGTTPLHCAAANGHRDLAMLLSNAEAMTRMGLELVKKIEVITRSSYGAANAKSTVDKGVLEFLRQTCGGHRRRSELELIPPQIRTKDFWRNRWMNLDINLDRQPG